MSENRTNLPSTIAPSAAVPDGSPQRSNGESASTRLFRKKPVVIEAWQVTNESMNARMPDWLFAAYRANQAWNEPDLSGIYIVTLEGTMRAGLGDWIICGIKGELYPCKPDIFEATYEPLPAASREALPNIRPE